MHRATIKHFGTPNELREFPKGRLELISIGGVTVGLAIFEPGWRWYSSVQPSCRQRELRGAACSRQGNDGRPRAW